MKLSMSVLLACVLLGAAFATACQSGQATSSLEEATIQPPTATPDQSSYWLAWQNGPHADTYDLESGPNTYCAKCHSPDNWDYQATIDPPPNCVSCKFPSEAYPRVAEGNPLVPGEEWASIGCNVCHRVENGIAESEFAWHNSITGYYETVSTATELCEKCHLDSEALNHKRKLGEGAHADFECTDCHDAHDASASCEACHLISMVNGAQLMNKVTPEPVQIGHSRVHEAVSCVGCHDASGMEVGLIEIPAGSSGESKEVWVTFRTTESPLGLSRDPYQSHNLKRSVECTRCHP